MHRKNVYQPLEQKIVCGNLAYINSVIQSTTRYYFREKTMSTFLGVNNFFLASSIEDFTFECSQWRIQDGVPVTNKETTNN